METTTNRNPNLTVKCMVDVVKQEPPVRPEGILNFPQSAIGMTKERVIGQDRAVGWFVSMLRLMAIRNDRVIHGNVDEEDCPRLNGILLMGETASGKTHLVKTALKVCGIESMIVDCSQLTGAGWRGGDLHDVAKDAASLLERTNSEQIAVVFDEFDKAARKPTDHSDSSSNVQPGLLKLLDGGVYHSMQSGGDAYGDTSVDLDTNRCLFIFLGAFSGIEDVVRDRLRRSSQNLGFLADTTSVEKAGGDNSSVRELVEACDLAQYGFMQELLGRLSAVCCLPSLSVESLSHIVKGASCSFERKFAALMPQGVSFCIEQDAADLIAQLAFDSGLGARKIEGVLAPIVAEKLASLGSCNTSSDIVIRPCDIERID